MPDSQAAAYGTFLTQMVDSLAALRSTNGWTFQIFTGALDRPGQNQNDPILQQVISVTNGNANVDGLDLHLHEDAMKDLGTDLGFIRRPLTSQGAGVTKPLSVTEFSLVGLWDAHEDDLLSTYTKWSAQYQYPSDWTMLDWINSLLTRATNGDPASAQEFGSFFQTQGWYPKHWFGRFVAQFSSHGVLLATYGLSAPPGVPGLSDACGSSAGISAAPVPVTPSTTSPPTTSTSPSTTSTTTVPPPPSTVLWVIDFLYNGALLGMGHNNLYVANPLVASDFAAAVHDTGGSSAGTTAGSTTTTTR
ncbi:MAG: hypothetical protein ACHQIG_04315 [Acidimicrobiia bacterium]